MFSPSKEQFYFSYIKKMDIIILFLVTRSTLILVVPVFQYRLLRELFLVPLLRDQCH